MLSAIHYCNKFVQDNFQHFLAIFNTSFSATKTIIWIKYFFLKNLGIVTICRINWQIQNSLKILTHQLAFPHSTNDLLCTFNPKMFGLKKYDSMNLEMMGTRFQFDGRFFYMQLCVKEVPNEIQVWVCPRMYFDFWHIRIYISN